MIGDVLRLRVVSALILLDAIANAREITEAELDDLRARLITRAVAGAR